MTRLLSKEVVWWKAALCSHTPVPVTSAKEGRIRTTGACPRCRPYNILIYSSAPRITGVSQGQSASVLASLDHSWSIYTPPLPPSPFTPPHPPPPSSQVATQQAYPHRWPLGGGNGVRGQPEGHVPPLPQHLRWGHLRRVITSGTGISGPVHEGEGIFACVCVHGSCLHACVC